MWALYYCAAVLLHSGICTCILVCLDIHCGPSLNLVSSPHQATPLHKAAEKGQSDTVKYLIEKGADLTIKDKFGVSE